MPSPHVVGPSAARCRLSLRRCLCRRSSSVGSGPATIGSCRRPSPAGRGLCLRDGLLLPRFILALVRQALGYYHLAFLPLFCYVLVLPALFLLRCPHFGRVTAVATRAELALTLRRARSVLPAYRARCHCQRGTCRTARLLLRLALLCAGAGRYATVATLAFTHRTDSLPLFSTERQISSPRVRRVAERGARFRVAAAASSTPRSFTNICGRAVVVLVCMHCRLRGNRRLFAAFAAFGGDLGGW